MCGRYTRISPPAIIQELFDVKLDSGIMPSHNVAPSQDVLAVRLSEQEGREPVFLRWGLIPSWAKDPTIGNFTIDPQGEAKAEKPRFPIRPHV